MAKLTARQSEVLAMITTFIETHRIPPTIREIAVSFGFNTNNAKEIVDRLVKNGHLVRTNRNSRALALPTKPKSNIPAGDQIRCDVVSEDLSKIREVDIPACLFGKKNFALVQIETNRHGFSDVLEGDLVAVDTQALVSSSGNLKQYQAGMIRGLK